jgi:hypothetical protein
LPEPGLSFRALVVDYHLVADDVAALLSEGGAFVRRISPRGLTVKAWQDTLRDLRPAFVLSINHSPELALLSSQLGTPYVSWTIDPLPRQRLACLPGTDVDTCLCFVHQRALVSRLSAGGLPDVRYLPLAAAGRRHREPCSSEELAPYRTAISFVGNSLAAETSALERALQHAGWAPALQQRVERWLQELADRAGRDASLGKLSPDDLPDWLPIESVDDSARFADLFDGRLAALHRSQVVRALSPLQIAVYGDPGWSRVAAGYRGPAGHGDELTKIYRASAVNLDIPRLYQRDIVTLRAFDVMAAGGALLTESASELSSLVPPGCMATYDSTEELVSRAEHLTTHPEQARDMAQAGRECIIREHLLEHRVTRLLDACRERGWIA